MLANALTIFRGDYRYLQYKKDVACLTGDSVGDLVCIRGDRVNGKWRVQRADPHDRDKMPAIGVLLSKSTPTVGVIQVFGACGVFSGLTPGLECFVGTSGITQTMPSVGPGGYAVVQNVGIAVGSDTILLSGEQFRIERT